MRRHCRLHHSLIKQRVNLSSFEDLCCLWHQVTESAGEVLKKILFVCVENAGRSQMAEAFARKYGAGKFDVSSAGNKPAEEVNSVVVEVMREKGIDIAGNRPKLLTFEMAQNADLIVTMGCDEQGICPGPFFKPTVYWKLEDPKGKPVEKVRTIRDEIERRVEMLVLKGNFSVPGAG